MDSVEVGQFSVILLFIYRFLLFWVALHKASPKIFYFFVSLLSFRLIYCYERTLREGLYLKWLQLCLALIEDVAEQQKFEQMYWQYRKLMFHCAKKRLQDDQLAEDAVSMAFLSVAQNMGMVKEAICSETKWLLVTIVERAAINLYKKTAAHIQSHSSPGRGGRYDAGGRRRSGLQRSRSYREAAGTATTDYFAALCRWLYQLGHCGYVGLYSGESR